MYCQTQLGELQKNLSEIERRGFHLAAISVDSAAVSQRTIETSGLTYPLVADTDRTLIRAYGVLDAENDIAWPAIFVVGGDGTVLWRSLAESVSKRAGIPELLARLDRLAPAASHSR